MELRHLRYFVTVAEELHFGRAAGRLGMSQPPLSQQIKALEEEIGVILLLRTKRRVELTAGGAAFLSEARKTLAQADLAIRAAQRAARGEIGELAVGFVSGAVYGKVPAIFQLMRTRYPEVALVLQDLTTEEQVEALQAHRLDVGLVRPPVIGAEALKIQVIWREPLVVALPHAHPLASRRKIAMKALAEEPFLQIPRHLAPGFYDQFIRVCAQAGFSPKIVQEARTTQTIVSLIAVGMGVSIVPASLRSLQRTGVVYRPLAPPVPTTDLAVIWRPDDKNPALRSFLKIIWDVAEIREEKEDMGAKQEKTNNLSGPREEGTGRLHTGAQSRP
jgi:DNA-binding transcriptional LysR family regulator